MRIKGQMILENICFYTTILMIIVMVYPSFYSKYRD